ncbi:Glucosamine-6-phosphate deaminase 1 [bioreactor metagenome]|uniref:Glucosamine-6-phosphate deaminase 1 n=1 Tax=bioreactor metagenome TaxID=1076179 RepID=A0A645EA18_9ZZZZ
MEVRILKDKTAMSKAAAALGADVLRKVLAEKGKATMVAATAPSQFEMMSFLIKEPGIDWSKVTLFHLDEYIGLPKNHKAGFRLNLKEKFIDRLPSKLAKVYFVDGDAADLKAFCAEMKQIMAANPVDLAFIGVGENGHIAFNDPPADFDTDEAFLVVKLDDACRQQQYGEGWFPTFDAVPTHALTMSVPRIFKSKVIVNVVPDERKAKAVKGMIEGPVTNACPASILQKHAHCTTFLDEASASLLKK